MPALGILLGVTLAILGYVFLLRARVRRADEQCARVLETAAATVRQGLPLEPLLFWNAAHENRGVAHHRLREVGRRLDMGEPLAEALGTPLRLSDQERAALAAADGTPAVAVALDRAAKRTGDRLDVGHRLAAAMVYPAIVLTGVVFVFQLLRRFREVLDSSSAGMPSGLYRACEITSFVIVSVAAILLVLAAVEMTARHVGCLVAPARTLRGAYALIPGVGRVFAYADAARFLDVVACRLDAGDDLSNGIGNAGRAASGSRLGRSAQRVAHALASGGDPGSAWRALPLPRGVGERAAVLSIGPDAAAHLRVLESRCADRTRTGADALVRLFPALGAVAIAVLLAMILTLFFVMQGRLLESIQ